MSFAVAWTQKAAEDIDEAWILAPINHREDIIEAIGEIESSLRNSPTMAGESREESLVRVFTVPPVTVRYRVEFQRQLVRVFAARVYRRNQ